MATRSFPSFPRTPGAAPRRASEGRRTACRTSSVSMTEQPEALYYMDHARTDEQRRHMEELEAAGICVFCPEHVEAHHREPIESKGEHWYVTKNDFPYVGT